MYGGSTYGGSEYGGFLSFIDDEDVIVISVFDGIGLTEALPRYKDTIYISEHVVLEFILEVTATDEITLSENFGNTSIMNISVHELLGISEITLGDTIKFSPEPPNPPWGEASFI